MTRYEVNMAQLAQTVFAQRAAFYTTSAVHKDKVVLDRIVAMTRPQTTDIMLDVATGTGHTAFAFAPHVRQVIGIDVTLEMLIEAHKLNSEFGIRNSEFRLADVHELPFEDEMFDIVTCRRSAHHFVDIRRALLEMKRVLKPKGRLVIDDRIVPEDDFVDATMNRLDTLHDGSHVREYRVSEWQRMLFETGFEVEAVEPYTKHRRLSSLTANVDRADVAQIEAIIAGLNEAQRAAMGVVEKDGETYTNHWYVTIVGVKSDE
jgi:ubiquinone/menaquinone biosynthesis C-methylase UbiE